VDSVDFQEDIHNVQWMLHEKAMVIYQKAEPGDAKPELRKFWCFDVFQYNSLSNEQISS